MQQTWDQAGLDECTQEIMGKTAMQQGMTMMHENQPCNKAEMKSKQISKATNKQSNNQPKANKETMPNRIGTGKKASNRHSKKA